MDWANAELLRVPKRRTVYTIPSYAGWRVQNPFHRNVTRLALGCIDALHDISWHWYKSFFSYQYVSIYVNIALLPPQKMKSICKTISHQARATVKPKRLRRLRTLSAGPRLLKKDVSVRCETPCNKRLKVRSLIGADVSKVNSRFAVYPELQEIYALHRPNLKMLAKC